MIAEQSKVKEGMVLAEWDPFITPVISETSGQIEWVDLNELTIEERIDERTGLVEKEVVPPKNKSAVLRPRIVVRNNSGDLRVYNLPFGAFVLVENGAHVEAGDMIAKRPKKVIRSGDITGGLPRVIELFEGRKPKEAALLAEISGVVDLVEDSKGRRVIVVQSESGEKAEYLVPKGKQILVNNGESVRVGEQLTDGTLNPHDILNVLGLKAVAGYLVEKIKEVYRAQGVNINDKQFEVIVRQMLRRVAIEEPGDSMFEAGEIVLLQNVLAVNQKLASQKKKPATFKPVLIGITRAALASDTSFISAASFQETPRVLTEAAVSGKIDYLEGLKENVILGRPIPAGTGLPVYRQISIDLAEEVSEKPTSTQESFATF
jgi:DNA-directed RNA polymerase subunit beta'